MGFDWEQLLGTRGAGISDAYEQITSDALYQDHPSAAPPSATEDPGDAVVQLPFDEI
ncbi:hypothetical protein [Pseudarthrobacter sp. NIBRBAC000502771]|uniref:hypothetical protein n=1 Tax=Pseudarthrobacter sp. NIBRBAC000502771 TaxID=2590774 RepID=UPI00143D31AE|nr:hypothetical protein [Pseudarthrobacter sp. NIBRBAC000502771]